MSLADYADFRRQTANNINGSISTMSNLSLSARSAASALAEPFNQSVFYLRESARSAGESAVLHMQRTSNKAKEYQRESAGEQDNVTLANTPTSISLHVRKYRSTFASSFENQVTGLNERRNIIGAHI